jgi:hypothetical protein
MKTRKLIYIGGWGRSGSSILANVLGSHCDSASVGELRYLWNRGLLEDKRCGCGENVSRCSYWNGVLSDSELKISDKFAEDLVGHVGSGATWHQLLCMLTGGLNRYRARNAEFLQALREIYSSAAREADVDVLIDASKTPPYAVNLLDNPDFEVHFIHLVRDPRAVAFSWSRKRRTEEVSGEYLPQYSAFKSSLYWLVFNALGLWFDERKDCSYLMVRYEDFCDHPAPTVEKILAHCGVQMTGRMCWRSEHTPVVSPQHSISGNPSRFKVGEIVIEPDVEWQKKMPRFARSVVSILCRPLTNRFGYD